MVIFNEPSNTRNASARVPCESLLAHVFEMASTLFHRPVFCSESKCNQASCAEKHALLDPILVICRHRVGSTNLVPTIKSKKHWMFKQPPMALSICLSISSSTMPRIPPLRRLSGLQRSIKAFCIDTYPSSVRMRKPAASGLSKTFQDPYLDQLLNISIGQPSISTTFLPRERP